MVMLGVILALGLVLTGCPPTNETPEKAQDQVINIAAIAGVTAPAMGAAPVTAITATAQYTGTVAWTVTEGGAALSGSFAASTAYTATITLTAKDGYTLTGVAANFFTVAGATVGVTNAAGTGVITAKFPATGASDNRVTLTAGEAVVALAADTTAQVTFTGASGVTGLTTADFTVDGGTFTSADVSGDTATVAVSFDANTTTTAKTITVAVNASSAKSKGRASVAITQSAAVSYTAVANGTDGTTTSTSIALIFSAAVTGLTAGDITVADGTGAAAKGLLFGSGTAWSIALASVTTQGDVSVSIAKSGIESATKTVAVYKAANAGDKTAYSGGAGEPTFNMVYVPGGVTFPKGTSDSGTAPVTGAYEIGETQVTYELWYAVRVWAESNGYAFSSPGREGSNGTTGAAPTTTTAKQEPVTYVSWFDTVVWLNALTEWVNAKTGSSLTAVYYYDSLYAGVAKNSTPTSNFVKEGGGSTYASAYAKPGTTGFRLPGSDEWELAARWRGNDSVNTVGGYTNPYFTKGDSASGATANYNDATATGNVAVYNAIKTAAVKSKAANALGLYDMSGNVWEWSFAWYPGYTGSYRIVRGGSLVNNAVNLQVGVVNCDNPDVRYDYFGFRPARTAN
jgi:formylglycine-generating enzyme required for sulfatase activity